MSENNAVIPLRSWVDLESSRMKMTLEEESTYSSVHPILLLKKQSLLRRTTVAYGIVELLKSVNATPSECTLDNFIVQVSRGSHRAQSWNDIAGVGMISASMQAQISEPSFLGHFLDDDTVQDNVGMYLEARIIPAVAGDVATKSALGSESESSRCHDLGKLLYELYSGGVPPLQSEETSASHSNSTDEPARKKAMVRYDKKKGKAYSITQHQSYNSLQDLGLPSSISLLVQNLIDDRELYPSLESASEDIHLLLNYPDCYLSDLHVSAPLGGDVQLEIKEGKLYGREREVSLITDAFCRVSAGANEAFFLGGYSGSGKTMLVNSLTARVNCAGGYVLTQKVDQMSKERPLDVLSAINNLCMMIKDNSSPQKLFSIAKELMTEFQDDFGVLARLLPNISMLCPQLAKTDTSELQTIVDSHNVSFTIQRFMRIVSSKSNPVVLFLDDCQWAGKCSFDLIYDILSDTRGSSCFFFVGSYRDNEVDDDHPLMELMMELDLACVETSRVLLSGLSPKYLNAMVAESLCIFPRIVKPLSDVIFEKTNGNPFFALEFLRSMNDSRLLKYSLRERRWIWDLDRIRSMNITDNVLYILTNKMTSLPEHTQGALKVLSCFGIKADTAIVEYLCVTEQQCQLGLDDALKHNFVVRIGSAVQFVHDKVREAAYGLLQENQLSQYHHDLGVKLLPLALNQMKSDLPSNAIFQIADQLNYDITRLSDVDMQRDVAELNFRAGSKAMSLGDFTTASSYSSKALALLPEGMWGTNYELCLQTYFLRAKASNSCGDVPEAINCLKLILDKGRCMDDKLDAHHYYLTILHACDKFEETFVSCCDVLSKLGEKIPNEIDANRINKIVQQTETILNRGSWLKLPKMNNSSFENILKLYSILAMTCYAYKPGHLLYCICRMIHISFEHGLSCYSILGVLQFAVALTQQNKRYIPSASKMGKAAMQLLAQPRFDCPSLIPWLYSHYYGLVASHTEPLQSCINMLRNGFKVGMSVGDKGMALLNSINLIRFGLHSGMHLPSLLQEVDYFLTLATKIDHKYCKTYLAMYREVASALIDKSTLTNLGADTESSFDETAIYGRALMISRTYQSFWLGHTERCDHYIERLRQMKLLGSYNELFLGFYGAINARRYKRGKVSRIPIVQKTYQNALKLIGSEAELCPSNYTNKLYLLKAEYHSLQNENFTAKEFYDNAIESARSSKFIHEQGLAAECAAFHLKNIGDKKNALYYFNQARECYEMWGSNTKIEFIDREVSSEHKR